MPVSGSNNKMIVHICVNQNICRSSGKMGLLAGLVNEELLL